MRRRIAIALVVTGLALGSPSLEAADGCGKLLGVDNNYECWQNASCGGNKRDKEHWRWYFWEYCTEQILMAVYPCGCSAFD